MKLLSTTLLVLLSAGPAVAAPLTLYDTAQAQAVPGQAQAGTLPPACTGFDTTCSSTAGAFKPPAFAFDYGGSVAVGIIGSNHGFGTGASLSGWIQPAGSSLTLQVQIDTEKWTPSRYHH